MNGPSAISGGPARVLEALRRHGKERPTSTAIVQADAGEGWTYGRLLDEVIAVGAGLEREVPPGSAVVVRAGNTPDFIAAYLGVLLSGRRVQPVSPLAAEPEVVVAAQRTGAGGAVGEPRLLDPLRSLDVNCLDSRGAWRAGGKFSMREGGDLLLQSSGTTGFPRIAVRSGASLDAVAENVVLATSLTWEDRVLVAIPLHHSYGMENGLLGPVLAGATVVLCPALDITATAAGLMRTGVTVFPGVPFLFDLLSRQEPCPARSLRLAYSAGTSMPLSVAARFAERFGVEAGSLYGATEVGSVTFGDPGDPSFDPAGVGRPMRGVSIRVLGPNGEPLRPGTSGEIAVRAPSMLTRYVDGAAPTLDGHFLTGDLGSLDDRGNLTISGRLKLLIDVGGAKVNPLEVERVLVAHPDVGECVVVPVPVSETVTRLRALIVARHGDVRIEDVRAYARSRLAPYKVPREWATVSSLPKTATGKVIRVGPEHVG